jgi:hypothetical protein
VAELAPVFELPLQPDTKKTAEINSSAIHAGFKQLTTLSENTVGIKVRLITASRVLPNNCKNRVFLLDATEMARCC